MDPKRLDEVLAEVLDANPWMRGPWAMRDPDRMEVMLDRIREIWKAHPDMRLMQMLINVAPRNANKSDLYMWEDDAVLEALKYYKTPRSSEE